MAQTVAALAEKPVADSAIVRLLARMGALVFRERGQVPVPVVAHEALVGPLARMDAPMGVEARLLHEALGAVVAIVAALVFYAVAPLVGLEAVAGGEAAGALLAFVTPSQVARADARLCGALHGQVHGLLLHLQLLEDSLLNRKVLHISCN